MEVHVVVDGEALRLAVVDERDAVEAVAHRGVYVGQAEVDALLQELFVAALARYLLAGHLHALLLRPPVVVLRLYLQEGDVAVHVGPDAHLLARRPAVVVLHVEAVVVGVPVGCHVVGNLAAVRELRIVLPLCQLQQAHQFLLVGHELCVRSVHEPDVLHLLQRDGLKFG